MGNAPAASVSVTLGNNVTARPYLHHALLTFVPQGSAFATGFEESTQSWMFRSPDTELGLVAELTSGEWASRLKSLGATDDEPVWTAVDAHFNQLMVADASGARPRLTKPDVVYIGRRTSAAITTNTFTFGTNTAGTVRIVVNQARYLYANADTVGALADVTVTADGVLTTTQLASAAVTALNNVTAFAAKFTASSALGVVTVVSDVEGHPLILTVRASAGGPTMTQAITTPNVADAYKDDLDEMQAAAEFGETVDPPMRRFYWVTDLQGDDAVNEEGMEWAEEQGSAAVHTPIRDYQFCSWSQSGARLVTIAGEQVGNFNPSATASAAQVAQAANDDTGWTRGGVHDHDRYEFSVPALLGRCIGYLPGEVSFTSKVLFGGTPASRIAPRDFGDDETLSLDRTFNWYSAEGPRGSEKWGYNADGKYMDQKWLEDYARYAVTTALVAFMQGKNIVTYTDADIKGGEATIATALATIPAIIASSIGVVSLGRDEVNPANIVARIYFDYVGSGVAAGVINRMGTPSDPIAITIVDG